MHGWDTVVGFTGSNNGAAAEGTEAQESPGAAPLLPCDTGDSAPRPDTSSPLQPTPPHLGTGEGAWGSMWNPGTRLWDQERSSANFSFIAGHGEARGGKGIPLQSLPHHLHLCRSQTGLLGMSLLTRVAPDGPQEPCEGHSSWSFICILSLLLNVRCPLGQLVIPWSHSIPLHLCMCRSLC